MSSNFHTGSKPSIVLHLFTGVEPYFFNKLIWVILSLLVLLHHCDALHSSSFQKCCFKLKAFNEMIGSIYHF